MTEDMPEDVKAAAREAALDQLNQRLDGQRVSLEDAFARAILAERRRCAQIAEDMAEHLADAASGALVAKRIAAAIRGDGNGEG